MKVLYGMGSLVIWMNELKGFLDLFVHNLLSSKQQTDKLAAN